jgi:hypothetical protein
MYITVDYCANRNSFTIDYDKEAQKAFRETAKAAYQFCKDDEAVTLLAKSTHQSIDQFIRGARMLLLLGRASSALTEVSLPDLRFGLNLSCFVALYRLDQDAPLDPILQTIMLLANTVPFPLPRTDLPPIEEVLDMATISPDVCGAYLRVSDSKNKAAVVLMPLAKVDQLGAALADIAFNHPGIIQLQECAAVLAAPYRFARAALSGAHWPGETERPS